ncbi:MAG: autotransporter-associated beta strand repeat-containing protein [Chthoniobacterales bacterium]
MNGGGSGHPGGYLWFFYGSSGGATRVELFGNGQLDISLHYAPGITIGSLEGDGDVFLGSFNLSIGSNALSTTFSGVIHDGGTNGGAAGSLIKVGSGTLALDGQSTYTGGTTVSEGVLLTNTQGGSATGTGAVQVAAGTFGGSGTIAGAVTIGTGSGSGAFLAPATGTNKQRTLTVQSQLTLNGDSTYTYTFKAKNEKAKTDKVIANGVTINSGATFVFSGTAQGTLTQGLVLTVISNTAATPISGSFSNLSDGAIVSVNGNNLQASYEGGDGNDLTLTVVP